MKLDLESPVSSSELRASTLGFSLLACILIIPLILIHPRELFSESYLAIIVASSLFWGLLSIAAFRIFWDIYYRYIYPAWLRHLAPLNIVLYGLIALGMWFLVQHLRISNVLVFVLLGGIEGLLEHVFGIYRLEVLNKVPWLKGLATLPVLLFSFVEYIVYWSLVCWIALGLQRLLLMH
jgi:hypothetical protein